MDTKLLKNNSMHNYQCLLPIEEQFYDADYVQSWQFWTKDNLPYYFILSITYFVSVLVGRKSMENREPYDLKIPLILWNWTLAIFSIMGSIRMLPEFYYSIANYGFEFSVCSTRNGYGPAGFWLFLFVYSKIPEFVDTLFIILRKKPLIFLHYYHHATTSFYSLYSYSQFASGGVWYANMNYFVHSIMYSYYALKMMRIRVPHSISKCITSLQIIQMFFGCYINISIFMYKRMGHECATSYENVIFSLLKYMSYFYLFSRFFQDAYIKKQKYQETEEKSKSV